MSKLKKQREIDKAIGHLMDYLEQQEKWRDLNDELMIQMMAPIAEQLDQSIDQVETSLFKGPYSSMAWGYVFEEMVSCRWHGESGTAIDEYLKQRGWREGPEGRRYLRALSTSEPELWEVTTVDPGESVNLRHYGTTDKPIKVFEKSATESIAQWDCLVARVLTMGSRRSFSGSILPFSQEGGAQLQEFLEQVPDNVRLTYEELLKEGEIDEMPVDMDQEISDETQSLLVQMAFADWAIQVMHKSEGRLPELFNTSNDRIVMTSNRFNVTGDKDTIRDCLSSHPELFEEQSDDWCWISADSDKNTVFGRIKLQGQILELETNSVERGVRGTDLIKDLFGDDVEQALGVHQNMESLLASSAEKPLLDNTQLQHSPEMQAMLQSHLTQHYRQTLDEPIPMLGNVSPRECAADPERRVQVVTWLKHLENSTAHAPGQSYDFLWMWEDLGLSAYRN